MKKIENIMYLFFIVVLAIVFVSCSNNNTMTAEKQLPHMIVEKNTADASQNRITEIAQSSYADASKIQLK